MTAGHLWKKLLLHHPSQVIISWMLWHLFCLLQLQHSANYWSLRYIQKIIIQRLRDQKNIQVTGTPIDRVRNGIENLFLTVLESVYCLVTINHSYDVWKSWKYGSNLMKHCHFVSDASDLDEPLCVFSVLNMASMCGINGLVLQPTTYRLEKVWCSPPVRNLVAVNHCVSLTLKESLD